MHKFFLKHAKLLAIVGCFAKNIATAIAFENMLISGFLGLMTGIMVKMHLFSKHPTKDIKHFKHQEIKINPNIK